MGSSRRVMVDVPVTVVVTTVVVGLVTVRTEVAVTNVNAGMMIVRVVTEVVVVGMMRVRVDVTVDVTVAVVVVVVLWDEPNAVLLVPVAPASVVVSAHARMAMASSARSLKSPTCSVGEILKPVKVSEGRSWQKVGLGREESSDAPGMKGGITRLCTLPAATTRTVEMASEVRMVRVNPICHDLSKSVRMSVVNTTILYNENISVSSRIFSPYSPLPLTSSGCR
ncbi:hypothetical protein C8Q80DRAFT_1183709 [Daedaleopsis nitida]|nr:hypothetical protein C8Q80DRAFT_1183709 [Daedaleopsis nitida]